MPFVRPSLVADSTNTSGTGTYTLTGADPGGGFRALVDAVGDGDAANADTISYFVVDTTTSGATLAWEHGTGTIGGGGTTLARTTIIESSNGDAAVSWGSGGTRTVRFGAGTAGFALLAAAQTFTALQTFSAGAASSETVAVSKSVAAAGFNALTMSNTATANVANITAAAWQVLDAGGTARAALSIQARLETLTAGNDSSFVNFQARSGGAAVNVFRITGGQLTDGSGVAYAKTGVLSAPSGGRLLWGVTAIPAGWSIVASLADKTILTTSTASEIDDTGGTWTITTTVDGTTLTTTQIPSHLHTIQAQLTAVQSGTGTNVVFDLSGATEVDTSLTGGGGSHDHTATTGGGGTWRPAYYKAGWIQKT